jgi:fimbrial chaperone protein
VRKRLSILFLIIFNCFFIFFLLFPANIFSANFSVKPIRIFLDSKNKTSILTVANNSEESITMQLRAYTWTQDEKGKDLYDLTKDIILFPRILIIKKQEEKIIRLGTRIPPGEYEKTYRLYIEEIPVQKETGTIAVRMILKMGVPIFIKPLKTEPKGSIEKIKLEKGKLAFSLKNSGNVHFIVRSITLRGINASGKEVFKTERGSGYLHSKRVKGFTFDIPVENCLQIKNLKIAVDTDRTSMTGGLDVLEEMCTT